jgi:hypothetical protein
MEIVGTRHLEPSSATRHKRTDSAKPVGCLQQPRFIAPGAAFGIAILVYRSAIFGWMGLSSE